MFTSSNKIGITGCTCIVKLLKNFKKLEKFEVNLDNNFINNEGAKDILE